MAAAPSGVRDFVVAQAIQQDDASKSNVTCAAFLVNPRMVWRPCFIVLEG
jgi:hypothetical protein